MLEAAASVKATTITSVRTAMQIQTLPVHRVSEKLSDTRSTVNNVNVPQARLFKSENLKISFVL